MILNNQFVEYINCLTDFTTLSASILTASDGVTYRGVRLSWSHSSSYHSCSYIYYKAYINGQLPGNRRREIDITFSQRQVDFLNLDCNTDYSFYLRLYYMSSSSGYTVSYSTRSVSIFYGSKWKNTLSEVNLKLINAHMHMYKQVHQTLLKLLHKFLMWLLKWILLIN